MIQLGENAQLQHVFSLGNLGLADNTGNQFNNYFSSFSLSIRLYFPLLSVFTALIDLLRVVRSQYYVVATVQFVSKQCIIIR